MKIADESGQEDANISEDNVFLAEKRSEITTSASDQ